MTRGLQLRGFDFRRLVFTLLPFLIALSTRAQDFSVLCADRTAIERVYYDHRLGQKPPFEQTLPPAAVENLVRQDRHKEAMLKQAYGVEISTAMLEAEVRRINATTRAPEMLAEIKAVLGNDPARFANAFAKPILVDRILRERFDNDDALHAPRRRQIEQMRNELLNAKTNGADFEKLLALLRRGFSNAVTETTWQLAARPAETNTPGVSEEEIRQRHGPGAQIMSTPESAGMEGKFFFEDLSGDLQKVLRVQLRKPGDISAVIETPGGFLLYVTKERTERELSVAVLSLPKRSFDEWLSEPARLQQ